MLCLVTHTPKGTDAQWLSSEQERAVIAALRQPTKDRPTQRLPLADRMERLLEAARNNHGGERELASGHTRAL